MAKKRDTGNKRPPARSVTPKRPPARSVTPEHTSTKGMTQPNAITIRGSDVWKSWLERFAAKLRSKPTAIIDLALAKLAAAENFEEPPPRMGSRDE